MQCKAGRTLLLLLCTATWYHMTDDTSPASDDAPLAHKADPSAVVLQGGRVINYHLSQAGQLLG